MLTSARLDDQVMSEEDGNAAYGDTSGDEEPSEFELVESGGAGSMVPYLSEDPGFIDAEAPADDIVDYWYPSADGNTPRSRKQQPSGPIPDANGNIDYGDDIIGPDDEQLGSSSASTKSLRAMSSKFFSMFSSHSVRNTCINLVPNIFLIIIILSL